MHDIRRLRHVRFRGLSRPAWDARVSAGAAVGAYLCWTLLGLDRAIIAHGVPTR